MILTFFSKEKITHTILHHQYVPNNVFDIALQYYTILQQLQQNKLTLQLEDNVNYFDSLAHDNHN